MSHSVPPVFHLIWGLECGGAQRIIAAIARHSPAGSFRHCVVSFHGDGPARALLAAAGCPATILHKRRGFDPSMPFVLRRLMEASPHGILHAHDFTGAFWGWLALRNRPGWRLVVTDHLASQRLGFCRRALYAAVLRRSGMVIALSESTRRRLRAWCVAEERLALGPVGPDLPPAACGARAAIRAELGVEPDQVLVLTCARLEPQKNLVWWVDLAIRADVRLRFVMAGEGSLAPELERRIRAAGAEGRVRLLGLRGDVQNLLAAADVFALPSAFEELPVSLLEAMAAGLPFVASPAGALPELMAAGCGGAGHLVPCSDSGRWLDCLAGLASDQDARRRMGVHGRAFVAKRFDVALNVADLVRLYERVASETKGGV